MPSDLCVVSPSLHGVYYRYRSDVLSSQRGICHLGLELEVLPLRIPVSEAWDLMEIGLLAGVSNLSASDGNFAAAHLGARVNLNFTRTFGVAAIGRTNFGFSSLEAAMISRF